jgi:hypothetical protein
MVSAGRPAFVVVRTLALMMVRRVLGLLDCGPTPEADEVEPAVLHHQLAVLRPVRETVVPVLYLTIWLRGPEPLSATD